jgi:nucleotide-binding universal stress UspA family protein
METIVCAVDDSLEAKEALRVAVRLSADAGLRLVVAHVENPPLLRAAARRTANRRGGLLLDRLLDERGVDDVDKRVEVGDRADELARVAEEEAASVIVVGSGHRRWWRTTRLSNLTADLAATAACPVVVVPPPGRR